MADRYQTIREIDLGAGLDAQSAENAIPAGYTENLVNVDPLPTGQLKTRKGYEGYLGYIPARVVRAEYTDALTSNLCLYLDGSVQLASVDLSSARRSPLLVLGKTSKANTANVGDFPNDETTVNWYSTFTTDIVKQFLTGTNTLSYLQAEHTLATPFLFVGTTASTSTLNTSNSQFYPDTVRIDKTTYDIEIDYTNGTPAFDGYVFLSNQSAVAGSSYVSGNNAIPPGTTTLTISAATHGLSNFNIVPQVYQDTGTHYVPISPDSLTVDNAGQVQVQITNSTAASVDVRVVLASAPIANSATGSAAADSSTTITVPTTTDFPFVACYLEQTIGGTFELVIPDSVVIDSAAKTAQITFTNGDSVGRNFQVYYQFARVATNKLCLDASVIDTADIFTDTRPQLTIYGIPHAELYGNDRQPRQGWTSHIDSYRSVAEDRLIAGLGGNFFSAQLRSEGNNAAAYKMPLYYPALRTRIAADTVIGPTFVDNGDTSARTRGYVQADTAADNVLEIDSATWDSGTETVVYRLLAPNMSIVGTLSTIISTTTGLEDRLQVTQMGHSRLNGTFVIKAVTAGADYLDIAVENSRIDSSDYDEVDAGGRGGIYSDRLTTFAATPFVQGDLLTSELFGDSEVLAASGTTVLINNVGAEASLPGGLRLVASRQGRVIPLRTADEVATVENLVRGDMLIYTGLANHPRVAQVRTDADQTVSISADGATATLTLSSGTTASLKAGDYILLRNSLVFGGEHVIEEVISPTQVTFPFASVAVGTAILTGSCIAVDQDMTISDTLASSVSVQVQGRWIPIEAPLSSGDLIPTTHIRYLDSMGYTEQEIVRSTMVQDNMYFVNGQDEVLKFDGQSVYRAGLPRWQTNLYLTKDDTATGVIVLNNPQVSYTANSSNRFEIALADKLVYKIGQRIEDSANGETYAVTDLGEDATKAYVHVDRTIDHATASGTLTRVSTFKYYARLNAVDINSNLIASAVVGADDTVVEIGANTAVRLRAVGFPALDLYDYDRLELQWYRTKADSPAPFYLLTTLPLTFNSNDGYIDYIDTAVDSDLIELDATSTALEGAELGTGWTEPLRASYITSAENRLILGNVRDYPVIDLQVTENANGPIEIADFVAADNRRWLLRKDNTDASTTTDMLNRIAFQFTSSSVNLTPATDLTLASAGVLEIASTAHGLTIGSWVYLFHSTVANGHKLDFAGHYQISAVPNANTFQIRTSNARAGTSTDVDRYAVAISPLDVPVFLGTDGNYGQLNGNRDTSIIPNYQFLAMRRAANALNSAMRKVDITIAGYELFSPWAVASAGNEFASGQLIVRQPLALDVTAELLIPTLTGAFDVFVNQVKRSGGSSAGSIERLFPSRLLQSFNNFPEIFDRPTVEVDIDSKSAVDVNTADGQAITSLIPFFGESAFGAALKGNIVVAFKENSIYLHNTVLKGDGAPSIQKIESQGKGCTAPYSVAPTRNGIIFANESGIYRLGQNLAIDYVGRKYERLWKQVSKAELYLATGHHFAQGNQYKLSIPVNSTENNQVAVYNHTREYEGTGMGSWTTYDNHAATGWANLLTTAYFATTDGQVMSIRNTDTNSDFRDDASSFDWSATLRAMDFGDAGTRKVFGWLVSYFRTLVQTDAARLESAIDMNEEFLATDPFEIDDPTATTGLSDIATKKIQSIRSSLQARIGEYLQVRYLGTCYDAPVELSGVDYLVAPKSYRGTQEAKSTTK